jgi:integrase
MYALQDAAHFGPVALKGIRETWVRAGYSRSTINKDQRRLVRIWKWGVGEELVPPDAWQALAALEGLRKGRTLAPEPVHVPPVDIARVQATIPHLSPIVADMVRLQLLTGCRPGEVCRLRPCDIDRSGDVWEYSPAGHKTEHHGRSRTVYLGPQAKAILAPYLFGDASQACFSPSDSAEWFRERRAAARKTPPSCGNRRGKRSQPPARSRKPRRPRGEYDASSYCQAIHLACRKAWPASREMAADPAKLRAWTIAHRWSPNQLRHTKATEIRRLYGIEAAQTILGHASIDVTQIYAEQDREQARSIVRAIG